MNTISNDSSKKQKSNDRMFVNYNIRGYKVRVILDSGDTTVMETSAAIQLAEREGKDLVQISFDKQSHLPVCKVIDYGKFKYEQSKRDKEAKKAAKANAVVVKQIQFTLTTDENDRRRLVTQAKAFLSSNDKVKLTLRLRNRRESQNIEMAKSVMRAMLQEFDGIALLDSSPEVSGREMSCILRKAK